MSFLCHSRTLKGVGFAPFSLLVCLAVFSAVGSAERAALDLPSAPSGTVVDWNATFSEPSGPSGTVGAFAAWDDGSGEALYVGAYNNSAGGIFTTAGGIAVNGIGRWNGVSWSALGSGLNGTVSSIVALPDELVVCGSFNRAGGVPVTGIARWNGHRWAGFGTDLQDCATTVVSEGVLYASGTLNSVYWSVARWTGSEWVAVGPGFDQPVSALAIYNGNLVAGGNFRTYDSRQIRNVAQWDGSEWQSIGAGLSSWVMDLAVHQGELIASGLFTYGNGGSISRVAHWDGNSWGPLGILSRAEALVDVNGELYAGTTSTNGGVVHWTGSAWVPVGGGADGLVYSAFGWQGDLYIGGTFGRAGSIAANRAARWNGMEWAALGAGIDGNVLDFVEHEGNLIAVGRFRGGGGKLSRGVARWTGSVWEPMGAGLSSEGYAVTVFESQIVAAGPFGLDGKGNPTSRIVRWDGSSWIPMGSDLTGNVYDLIVYNGELIVGGDLKSAGGVALGNVARWSGSAWVPFGIGALEVVVSTMIIYDGQLVASGYDPLGVGESNAVRWDGQTWQPLGTQPSREMPALAVLDNVLYGTSAYSASPSGSRVFRWDGASWIALPGLSHRVYSLAVYENALVAAGTNADGSDIPVSRWDGNAWSPMGASFDTGMAKLFVYQGQLLASGNFRRTGNLITPYIAAYGPAQLTQTTITASSPSPSAIGQSVQISVEVSGLTAPSVGYVTVTGAPGGACSDLELVPNSGTTAQAQCTIQWTRGCPRWLTANYMGGTDGTTTWQPSKSELRMHWVTGGIECADIGIFADSFE
jgi:trimeric autotransporter adhesin